jgi:hypothetical protein
VTFRATFVLAFLLQLVSLPLSWAQTPSVIGSWKAEVTFSNGQARSLRFEAQPAGKGSFQLLVPEPKQGGSTEASIAQWTQDKQAITFSGTVQFPLGNVGLERGTLVLKGKQGTDGSISGEATFYSIDQNPNDPKATPSKTGTFKASKY